LAMPVVYLSRPCGTSSLSDLAQDFFCWDLNGNGVGASEKHGYSFRPH
jgi:hypothetical protein